MADISDTANGSHERVAYDLAMRIFGLEYPMGKANPTEIRKYLLDLYGECYIAAGGQRPSPK